MEKDISTYSNIISTMDKIKWGKWKKGTFLPINHSPPPISMLSYKYFI